MPNATCFLIAYTLVFIVEVARFAAQGESLRKWLIRGNAALLALAILTHTLYLVDRVLNAWNGDTFVAFRSWHDWSFLVAWTIALASAWMSWRRSDKQIGLFILPLVIAIVAVAVAVPSASPIGQPGSSASFWRLVHSAAMLIGTMLVALGFAIAAMYFVQAWRLKHLGSSAKSIRLPSLEYLHSTGRICILGSAFAVGFGVVSGAIMNWTQDGQVAWTDRGILFSTALFVWLTIAALLQWVSSHRGRGEWTAALSILSFVIVIIALAIVMTTPHGNKERGASLELPRPATQEAGA